MKAIEKLEKIHNKLLGYGIYSDTVEIKILFDLANTLTPIIDALESADKMFSQLASIKAGECPNINDYLFKSDEVKDLLDQFNMAMKKIGEDQCKNKKQAKLSNSQK